MAFLAQNDTGTVDNANSHVTYAAFLAYHLDRGTDYSNIDDYPQATVEAALIRATDYQNNKYKYIGWKVSSTQGTQFPRYYLYDPNDPTGAYLQVIPEPVKIDCYELAAYMIDNAILTIYGDISAASSDIKMKKTKVDVLEKVIEYFGSIDYDSLVVGNAQNVINCGWLVIQSGIYL